MHKRSLSQRRTINNVYNVKNYRNNILFTSTWNSKFKTRFTPPPLFLKKYLFPWNSVKREYTIKKVLFKFYLDETCMQSNSGSRKTTAASPFPFPASRWAFILRIYDIKWNYRPAVSFLDPTTYGHLGPVTYISRRFTFGIISSNKS